MEERSSLLWQSARPLIGSVIGVGIFGLPYVFWQAGYVYGLIELIGVAGLSLVSYFMYADLLAVNKGHTQFVAVIGKELGPFGRGLAAVAFMGSLWGALLAYMIVGGQFLATVLRPVLGGGLTFYQILFWLLASVAMVGGPFFVRRIQATLIPLLFVIIACLVLFSMPHLRVEYLTTLNHTQAAVPLGALLFAFAGFAAIPECRRVLGRMQGQVRKPIILATGLVVVIYALFALAIVGMTGPFTTPQALDGLKYVAGPWLPILVSALGLCTVFTAYISIGSALLNTLVDDFRGRFLASWGFAVAVPCVLFLLGARSFIGVIGTTGGVLGGLCGLILVVAYERARLLAHLPKRALTLPQPLIVLCFMAFVGMIVMSLF